MQRRFYLFLLVTILYSCTALSQGSSAGNPVIYADVPDMSMIRVGDTYYMSSTTMHMAPGVPIMKSKDLVNWELVNYCYDILADVDALNLNNGKNAYGSGTWASCIRYHNNMYYVSTFSSTTGKTYIYATEDIEKGPWKTVTFTPSYHDHTVFFDDDGRIYIIWGGGKLHIAELKPDLSGIKEAGGGALPGGIGWYRKTFTLPETDRGKVVYVDFDGVYRNSEVWINGHSLGFRPNGYVSFRYDLTPYLRYGSQPNVIVVKADNSEQPNSRWYSGSGIYRNVWLVKVNPVHVDNWGTFVHDMYPLLRDSHRAM